MGSSTVTLLGGALLILLCAGYFAQKSLPPPPPKLLGIDLGTTYSCIGAYQAVSGDIIIYEDEEHHKCIPSIVAFSGDSVLVGYKALRQQEENAENTIYDAKRFIGKRYSQRELDHEAKRYQFKMTLDSENLVNFVVKFRGEHIRVRPEEIGGHIVRTLRENVERNITAPKQAVVSVPAEFGELQRNMTRKAVNLAGFDVYRVINEPTAAALAYGLHKMKGVYNIMVVDLGGGTLDVSLLAIQGGMFVTMAMAGNNHLGGQDFNNQLQKYVVAEIESEYQHRLSDPEDIQIIRTAVEAAKIALTTNQTAQMSVPLHSLTAAHGRPVLYQREISREEFNKVNAELFAKVLEPIKAVLEHTELTVEDIDEVVMVGGSTRVPRVRQLVSKYFNNKVLNTGVDPDLAVVTGDAVQAGIIGGMWPLTVSAVEVQTSVKKIHVT